MWMNKQPSAMQKQEMPSDGSLACGRPLKKQLPAEEFLAGLLGGMRF